MNIDDKWPERTGPQAWTLEAPDNSQTAAADIVPAQPRGAAASTVLRASALCCVTFLSSTPFPSLAGSPPAIICRPQQIP